jgi:hypothetical protein
MLRPKPHGAIAVSPLRPRCGSERSAVNHQKSYDKGTDPGHRQRPMDRPHPHVASAPPRPDTHAHSHSRPHRESPRRCCQRAWMRRRPLRLGSAAWHYLAGERRLPPSVLAEARLQDAVREGPYGSAWFAHRDAGGTLTGFEMRGPDCRRFSAGGDKTLFYFRGGAGLLLRLAMCEAPIDALGLAALKEVRWGTLYLATGGGVG